MLLVGWVAGRALVQAAARARVPEDFELFGSQWALQGLGARPSGSAAPAWPGRLPRRFRKVRARLRLLQRALTGERAAGYQ
eukprot:9361319-Alexandrium_andersonii.AAC.1